jgi:hypothetical protein
MLVYEGYSESNLRWAVNKSNEKKLLYTKNTYILRLLVNVVTPGIEAVVLSGNKFLYACVRGACRLWAQPRFVICHQFLNIAEALWSQPVIQVGTSVIRAVRRVVKQLPVDMLQQCSSATVECGRAFSNENRYFVFIYPD